MAGNGIGRFIPALLPLAAGVMVGGAVGSVAMGLLRTVAGGLMMGSGFGPMNPYTGGVAGGFGVMGMPMGLPAPGLRLRDMAGMSMAMSGHPLMGAAVSGGRSIMMGGMPMGVPGFGMQSMALGNYMGGGSVGMMNTGRWNGAYNPALVGLGGYGTGNPLSKGLSQAQREMLGAIEDPAAKARMAIQFALQNQAEIAQFVSNVGKLLHDISRDIIRNIQS